jgi:hypothetical protein
VHGPAVAGHTSRNPQITIEINPFTLATVIGNTGFRHTCLKTMKHVVTPIV